MPSFADASPEQRAAWHAKASATRAKNKAAKAQSGPEPIIVGGPAAREKAPRAAKVPKGQKILKRFSDVLAGQLGEHWRLDEDDFDTLAFGAEFARDDINKAGEQLSFLKKLAPFVSPLVLIGCVGAVVGPRLWVTWAQQKQARAIQAAIAAGRLRPVQTPNGVVLVPVDPQTGAAAGPASPAPAPAPGAMPFEKTAESPREDGAPPNWDAELIRAQEIAAQNARNGFG